MYHCEWRQVGNVFSSIFLNRAENIANLAPCPGSNLTWVHQLWLSWNLVSMENHYDYDVLMVQCPVWVLTISVQRLDAFLERECRSHWLEQMYHCEWRPVRNKEAGWEHCEPGAMSRFQFDMGTSAMAELKFGFHGEPLRLRGFDGAMSCMGSHDFCSKTGRISGKGTQVPLIRANVPLWMAPGWQCFQLDFLKPSRKHGQPAPMSRFQFDMGTVSMGNHYDYEVLMVQTNQQAQKTLYICPV